VNQYMRNKVPGHIGEVRFRNVAVSGTAGAYRVQIEGADKGHAVRGVTFDQVTILGERLNPDSKRLQVGQHTEDIRFGSGTP
jgi:hypothetical protein